MQENTVIFAPSPEGGYGLKCIGYSRVGNRYEKAYVAYFRFRGRNRYSRRSFRRAHEAQDYGDRLVTRYAELMKCLN